MEETPGESQEVRNQLFSKFANIPSKFQKIKELCLEIFVCINKCVFHSTAPTASCSADIRDLPR